MLTVQEIQAVLPPHLRSNATQELADTVNQISTDPEVAASIRENFISYTSVLKEGRFKTEDYAHAVAYVSYKLMGYSNLEAYKRTFINRYTALVARGATDKDISAYVSAYNKNKLVNLILEQTLIPSWVLNQDLYQKAINTQAELMLTSNSDKVRTEAANSLLTHLKRPEKQQVELNIGVAENSGIGDLRNMLTQLAEQQRALIEAGSTTREIAHQRLIKSPIEVPQGEVIDAEVVEVQSPDPAP